MRKPVCQNPNSDRPAFFWGTLIGQRVPKPNGGCPIHQRYRTTSAQTKRRLSDSSVISDNEHPSLMSVVRFIIIIGQRVPKPNVDCPIHQRYRTSSEFRMPQRYSFSTDQASNFSGNDLTCLPRMGLVEGSGR